MNTRDRAWALFTSGLDTEYVARRLGIDPVQAQRLYNRWLDRAGGERYSNPLSYHEGSGGGARSTRTRHVGGNELGSIGPTRRVRPVVPEPVQPVVEGNTGACGTYRGWARHIRAGERPCDPCKLARSEYRQGLSRAAERAAQEKVANP